MTLQGMRVRDITSDIILKKNSLYFDFTASGLGLKSIEKEILSILKRYANIHSEGSLHASFMQNLYESSRQEIKDFLGLDASFSLINTGFGCSSAIKRFQEIMGIYVPPLIKQRYFADISKQSLPLVVIGPYEHHSNELSFREGLCECVRIRLDKEGLIDYEYLKSILKNALIKNPNRQIIASFSACSNVTGVRTDYKLLSSIIRSFGGILALDMASLIAHENIDCSFIDALFIGSHKLLGGVGACGLLAIKSSLIPKIPSFAGGGTVDYVSRTTQEYKKDAQCREEGGTPGIIAMIRAAKAFANRDKIGLDCIKEKEASLARYFEDGLLKLPNVTLYAASVPGRLPVFSFNFTSFSPYELSRLLSHKYGIETRAGCSCAGPYGHDLLSMQDNKLPSMRPGWLRISLHYTHSYENIDYLLSSLKSLTSKQA